LKMQLYAVWGIAALGAVAGCSSNSGQGDGGATGSTGTSGSGSSTSGSAAQLRLANLIPTAPGLDLCIAPHGSQAFEGPLLASLGLSSGVRYTDVSTYLAVPAGAFDFRLVAGGGSCSQPLSGTTDLTDLPPLAAGAGYTVAEIPRATPPTQIFEDDLLTSAAGTANLRLLNVSSTAPALDLGSVEDGGFDPWITGVQFLGVGGTAQGFPLDANGYLQVPATPNVHLQLESQSADLLDLSPPPGAAFPLSDGSLYTLFALPGAQLGGLFCADQSTQATGYAACVLYPIPGVSGTGTTGGTGSSSGTSSGGTGTGTTTGGEGPPPDGGPPG
jgi:hypothetical protein